MNNITSIITKSLLVAIAILLVISFFRQPATPKITVGSVAADKCNVSTTTSRIVGSASSTIVLEANETRAYAKIETLFNATNTIYLSFDEGAAAVASKGTALGTTTATNPSIVFGRNTDFPYTGAVMSLASNGTTTVLVTECSY